MKRLVAFAVAGILVGACSKAPSNNTADTGGDEPDASAPDAEQPDDANNGSGDGGSDAGADAAPDTGEESPCLQVATRDAFRVGIADDVSIEYFAVTDPAVEGKTRDLSLLFEPYNDAQYIGTFELGTGVNANFGDCHHCIFMRSDARERAFFADRGTLVSNTNPFSRQLDIQVTNLRLAEVEVDPLTRESTPVENGICIEVADFSHQGAFPPDEWTCAPMNYNNGVACDCECGAYDPDCAAGSGVDCLPGDPTCTPPGPDPLPVAGCEASEVCAFDPLNGATSCFAPCDYLGRTGCTTGTCVFDLGVGDGDLCIDAMERVAPTVALGEPCPTTNYQVVCNVVDGFAEGYCGPDNICRPVCQDDAECTVAGETCRKFVFEGALGYCGPEPIDG